MRRRIDQVRSPLPELKALKIVLSFLLLPVLLKPTMYAQEPAATLTITVRDQSGAAIPGVELILTGDQGSLRRTSLANQEGVAVFSAVPAGTYDVQATRTGFAAGMIRNVRVRQGEPEAQVLTLQVAGVSQRVNVEGTNESYTLPKAATATKTDTPLMETPFTVQVIPQRVLKDLDIGSSGMADALAYQGVQSLGKAPATEDQIYRGFQTSSTLWNGIRIEELGFADAYGNGGVWMDDVERLEVLKGPSSILYGRAQPGGAVNILTRKPQADFHGEVRTGIGSWSNPWVGLDLTGPLNKGKTLNSRLNASWERSDSYYHYGPEYRSSGIAPALSWRVTRATTIGIEGQFRNLQGINSELGAIPIDPATGRPLNVDPYKYSIAPGTLTKYRQSRTMLTLDHRFHDQWSLSWKYLHDAPENLANQDAFYNNPQFPIQPDGSLVVSRWPFYNWAQTRLDATTLDLTGHLKAFGIRHTLLFGAEYYKYRNHGRGKSDFSGDPAYNTDYLNPSPLPTLDAIPADTLTTRRRQPAVYLQDQMSLPANVHLLLGVRWQRLDEASSYNAVDFTSSSDYRKGEIQPRFGVLWRPQAWVSTYYNYSKSMGASTGLAYPGTPLPPQAARQHELGVKTEWLHDRLIATAAVFDITKFNLPSADVDHPGFNIAFGEVTSKGYEFGLQGELTANWSVLFNHTYARPKVTKAASGASGAPDSSTPPEGSLLPFISNRVFSLLSSHRLPWEWAHGWTIGGSVQWASDANPYYYSTLPTGPYTGYTLVSTFVSYRTKVAGLDTTLQLNVNNLFDERYQRYFLDYGGMANGDYGAPRQVRLSLRVGF